jgi:hypothetical protein
MILPGAVAVVIESPFFCYYIVTDVGAHDAIISEAVQTVTPEAMTYRLTRAATKRRSACMTNRAWMFATKVDYNSEHLSLYILVFCKQTDFHVGEALSVRQL